MVVAQHPRYLPRPILGGAVFELLPTSETNFFMQKRDIKVAFSVDKAGKGQGLAMRERGAVVGEAALNP